MRASSHTWPCRVCIRSPPPPPPPRTPPSSRVSTRRVASTPSMMTSRDPRVTLRARVRHEEFLRRAKNLNGTPRATAVVSVGEVRGFCSSSSTRRLVATFNKWENRRCWLSRLASPRLASCLPSAARLSSPRRALVTPTYSSLPRIPLGVPCGVFILAHSASSRVYECMRVRARKCVCVYVDYSHSRSVADPLSSLCLPRVWHQLRDSVRSFLSFDLIVYVSSLDLSGHRINLRVRTKMMSSWCLINILV